MNFSLCIKTDHTKRTQSFPDPTWIPFQDLPIDSLRDLTNQRTRNDFHFGHLARIRTDYLCESP
jgi:hypothetical protein